MIGRKGNPSPAHPANLLARSVRGRRCFPSLVNPQSHSVRDHRVCCFSLSILFAVELTKRVIIIAMTQCILQGSSRSRKLLASRNSDFNRNGLQCWTVVIVAVHGEGNCSKRDLLYQCTDWIVAILFLDCGRRRSWFSEIKLEYTIRFASYAMVFKFFSMTLVIFRLAMVTAVRDNSAL